MRRKSFKDMACPIAQSLEVMGEWWTPLVLRDILLYGRYRFDELATSLGIAPNVLIDRLQTLTAEGVLTRRQYSDRPVRYEYVPTAKGLALGPVLLALADWGNQWQVDPSAPSRQIRHSGCGQVVHAAVVCSHCGEPLDVSAVDVRPRD